LYANFRYIVVVLRNKKLNKIKKDKLYLNINKCNFSITQIKYLDLIITIDNIKKDLIKIEAILR